MAGANLSPRQKMISLMYLVLLAMLAMQVSVEVMEAFSKMYDRTEQFNVSGIKKNEAMMETLKTKAEDSPKEFKATYEKAQKVDKASRTLEHKLEEVKQVILEKHPLEENGKLPATAMGKGDVLDEYLFKADGFTENGAAFVAAIDAYRNEMISLFKGSAIADNVQGGFNTGDIEVEKGLTKSWLDYNFKGFPAIGSVASLSSLENLVVNIENEALSSLLTGRLEKATSIDNVEAIFRPSKSAFFVGEKVTGEIFLASKDASKVPTKAVINGKVMSEKAFSGGKLNINLTANRVGDQPIVGEFTFMENGKVKKIAVKSSYAVVPKPNDAVVSADKMNVVYRGLENPITVSMPGIADNKLKVSGVGLKKTSGVGKYVIKPGSGKEAVVNVTGTTDAGEVIKSAPVKFRIKSIPQAMASLRGKFGTTKMPKTSLAKATITAGMPDFLFDLKFRVTGFKVKVPGRTTVIVNGAKLNAQAQKAIAKAKRGDIVTIFDVKTVILGNSKLKLPAALPISVEITQ